MSFLDMNKKQKKPINAVELQDKLLSFDDQIAKFSSIAHGRKVNFDKDYTYLENQLKLIQSRKTDKNKVEFDKIPIIIKDASNDVMSIKEIINELQKLQLIKISENNVRQQIIAKLTSTLKEMNDKLQDISKKFQISQQDAINRLQETHTADRDSLHQLGFQQVDMEELDEHLIEKRQQQLNQIGREMNQLKDIMLEGALMIEKQGEQIDQIHMNIKTSKGKVKDAGQEIVKASAFEQSSNKRNLMLCGIITMIVLVIVLLVNAGSKDKSIPQTPPINDQPEHRTLF